MRRVSSVVAITCLTACVAPPPQVETTPPAAASGPFSAGDPAFTTVGPVPADWWQLFDDPILNAHVERALAANADLRVATANLEIARTAVAETDSSRLPATVIESGAGPDRADTQPSTSSVPKTSYELGATLQYEVDLFGRARSAMAASQADAMASQSLLEAARVMVAADATAAYIDICDATATIAAQREQIAMQASVTEIISRQLALGEVSPLELSAARTLGAQLASALPDLEAARGNALYRLAVLQGMVPSQAGELQIGCASTPSVAQAIPVSDGAALIARRPDIREAEARLAAATARIGIATADLYPRISLGGSAGLVGGGFASILTPLIAWSFPNQQAIRARIAAARGSEVAALARWDSVMLNALREVETALNNHRAQQVQHDNLTAAFEQADLTAMRARARVRLGADSYLTSLDAERTRAAIALQLVASRHRIALAQVALFRALGGGWD